MPPSNHLIYIPGILLLGIMIGFVLGARAAREQARLTERREAERAAARAARAARRAARERRAGGDGAPADASEGDAAAPRDGG
ncbi:MAG: hypothetical protein D6689_03900 [Deltaproteobacteria bacterium]|nr:MAG: hypothetical protein D6689_03900 [Deltaproteobacteria bacterium]